MHNLENLATHVRKNENRLKTPGKSRSNPFYLFGSRPGKKTGKEHTEQGEMIKGVYFDPIIISFLKKALIGDDPR